MHRKVWNPEQNLQNTSKFYKELATGLALKNFL